jgi:hypothetical protein
MKPLLISLALVCLAAPPAKGATLGLTGTDPTLVSDSAAVAFLDLGGSGELLGLGAVTSASGIAGAGLAIAFGLGYDASDPSGTALGGFDVTNKAGDVVLAGELVAVGSETARIELIFDSLLGPAAGLFGGAALMLVDFEGLGGIDPFEAFADGTGYGAQVTLSSLPAPPAPVPLPGGLVLIVTGLGALAALRRRAS